MPSYSLRARLGSYPEKPDEEIGTFPNPRLALDAVNEHIGRAGKDSGSEQVTIKSFGFDEAGLDLLCALKYSLVEKEGTTTREYRLFPAASLGSNLFKTINAEVPSRAPDQ